VLPSSALIGAITEAADVAIRDVASRLDAGRIEQEPDFTSQFVAAVQGELRRAGGEHYVWDLKVLTDRGRGSQESRYGADLLVVQHIDTDGYRVTKGFLAQAKLEGRRIKRQDLVAQCKRMLQATPDSFVFQYGSTGILVASASAASAAAGALEELRWKPFSEFLLDFMTSFVGDRRLRAATAEELESIMEEHRARMGLHIHVAAVPPDAPAAAAR